MRVRAVGVLLCRVWVVQVTKISQKRVDCNILAVDGHSLAEPFRGFIRYEEEGRVRSVVENLALDAASLFLLVKTQFCVTPAS